ncbi:hypothetical protein ACFFVB_18275 [Formosa undariae]|uniref:Uncharacterized protein n=1 Tax=Formosa undariae TaxID=1325436 RepID=A0ABV5F6G8_9FLAO
MNTQSKINTVKSRIKQIETSDLFTELEREKLINVNRKELQFLQAKIDYPIATFFNDKLEPSINSFNSGI